MPTSSPRVSVLVVGYNCPEDVGVLLSSLRALPSWSDCEILVAENGSAALPEMEALARDHGARLVPLPNPGFGIACNRLAALATGDVLLLANPDLRFRDDILPALCAHLQDGATGAVGPAIFDDDGTEQISWNLPMDLWWEFLEAHGLQTRWRRHLMRRMREASPEGPWEVGFATAACLAIPRRLYLEIGGFDEGFFLNGEDIEICDRVRAKGLRVVVDPRLRVFHGNSSIQGRNLERFVRDRLEGKRKYLSRRYAGFRLFVARALWVEMVAIRLVAGTFLLRGTERTRLPGYRRVLLESLRLLFSGSAPSPASARTGT
jgi:GT2 family glycosyltransferase